MTEDEFVAWRSTRGHDTEADEAQSRELWATAAAAPTISETQAQTLARYLRGAP